MLDELILIIFRCIIFVSCLATLLFILFTKMSGLELELVSWFLSVILLVITFLPEDGHEDRNNNNYGDVKK